MRINPGYAAISPANEVAMREAQPRYSARHHDPALDGVRGAAILAVIGLHAHVVRGGMIGVDLFFALSGFLITGIIFRSLRSRDGFSFAAFYYNRLLRLGPALYVLVISAILIGVITGQDLRSSLYFIPVALYLSNYTDGLHLSESGLLGHSWSLAVEAQFYLFWPSLCVISWKISRRVAPTVVIAIILIATSAVWRTYLLSQGGFASIDWTYRALHTRLDALLFGSIAALWGTHARKAPSATVFGLSCAFIVAMALFVRPGNLWFQSIGLFAIGLASACVVSHVASNTSWLARQILSWPVLTSLGEISYGIYLYHFPIMTQASALWGPKSVWLSVPVSVAVAYMSYHYLEAPFLRLKWRKSPSGEPLDAARLSEPTATS